VRELHDLAREFVKTSDKADVIKKAEAVASSGDDMAK